MRITMLSHCFIVDKIDYGVKPLITDFTRRNIQFTTEYRRGYGYIKKPYRVFAAANAQRTEYRFHRHEFEKFKQILEDNHIKPEQYTVRTKQYKKPARILLTRDPKFQDRDYQVELIKYLSDVNRHCKVVPLQTGKGKTYVAMRACENIGFKAGLVTSSRYLNQWQNSFSETFNIPKTDVWIIRGAQELKKYIKKSIEGSMDYTFVLFSNTTLQIFIKKYEMSAKKAIKEYGCKPEDLYEIGGLGIKLVDEAHQNLHLNFKLDLYNHVITTIYLSATLETEDAFVNRITDTIYPEEYRFTGIAYDKYIAAQGWMYKLAPCNEQKIRTSARGRESYSHSEFEKSILKNKKMLENYLAMIAESFAMEFIKNRTDKKQKCLIFADLVEMCTVITEYLKVLHPALDIRRYTGEDSDDNLYTPDVVITTPGSCGTGKDVPNLMYVFMTNAIGGMQLNLQMLGRLRRLKDFEDITPQFIYFICEDIPKHMDYHRKKFDVFSGKVLSHTDMRTNFVV